MKKLLILPFVMLFLTMACEKDVINYMEQLYLESQTLSSCSTDSVKSFVIKVNNYVSEFPKEKENPLYPKVLANIKNTTIGITLECDTAWDGTIYINF